MNHPEGATEFEQLVRVGRCLGTGAECGRGAVFSETRTECRQNHLEHKLVTITEDGEDVVVDTFRFPSCCTCHVVRPIYDYDK